VFEGLLRTLLAGRPANGLDGPEALRLAVAALLVMAAQADDHFEEPERAAIRHLLSERFGLAPPAVDDLLAAAQQQAEEAAGLFPFVKAFVGNSRPEERVWLVEMLWEVAYADGTLTPDEDALIRKVAGLVYVSDVERGAARRRVEQRLTRRK
jgi:uncharacterized tellurite resistance protein B-like protein